MAFWKFWHPSIIIKVQTSSPTNVLGSLGSTEFLSYLSRIVSEFVVPPYNHTKDMLQKCHFCYSFSLSTLENLAFKLFSPYSALPPLLPSPPSFSFCPSTSALIHMPFLHLRCPPHCFPMLPITTRAPHMLPSRAWATSVTTSFGLNLQLLVSLPPLTTLPLHSRCSLFVYKDYLIQIWCP